MKHVKSFKLYENVNSEIKTFGPDEHLEFCKAVAEMAKAEKFVGIYMIILTHMNTLWVKKIEDL